MKDETKQRFGNQSAKKLDDIPVPRSHPDYMKYYRKVRKQKLHEIGSKWAENNKEIKQAQWRSWYQKNKEKQLAKYNFEKAEKLKRTPLWVNKEELKKIYENCPEGYHVDHIVPLRGKKVSGLHVPWNLQYLSAEENLRKSNKF